MRIPIEVKSRIYEHVFGGNLIHIAQNADKSGPKFRSYICNASISDEDAEYVQDFLASESNTDPWNAPGIENRHLSCHEGHKSNLFYKRPGALSLSPLRSCRQMYNEAHHVPYSTNSFSSADPKTLQKFVVSLAQGNKGNHQAIRSLFLEIVYAEDHHMTSWKKAIATCAKYLTRLQHVSISIEWHDFFLIKLQPLGYSLVGAGMRWKEKMISSLLTLKKLPLKTVIMTISDHQAERKRRSWHYMTNLSPWIILEAEFRWTLIEKRERARYVEEILLQS